MRGLLAAGLLAAAAVARILSSPQFGGTLQGARLTRARANPRFRDGKFTNEVPPAVYRLGDYPGLLDRQFFGPEMRVPPGPIPVRTVSPEELKNTPPAPSLRAFWIGHSSVYVEIDGVRLLIDPVFSEYASPFNIGPRRFHPPPLRLEDLPPIDAVLITHDHYDHLDMRTIRYLSGRGTMFFVPLGIGAHLDRWAVPAPQLQELEWWQECSLRGVRLISTPARHYSGRGLTNQGATLWTSWSVIGEKHRFFVSGDSGYGDHFRAVGERFGPFDLSFMVTGAYGPGAPWLDLHMDPEHAVRAHLDVRARRLVPLHWGTFNLALHAWDEPIKRTVSAARTHQVDVLTPQIGEMIDADQPFASHPWWETIGGLGDGPRLSTKQVRPDK